MHTDEDTSEHKLATNRYEHVTLRVLLLTLLAVSATSLYAQPDVTFEFESMFGKKAFYDRGPNFDTNSIPPEGFNSPTGAAFQGADKIIVADRNNNKLQSCDDQGDCFWIGGDAVNNARNQPGIFDLPHGVSVSPNGSVNVADEDNQMLQVCDKNGNCEASGRSFSNDTLVHHHWVSGVPYKTLPLIHWAGYTAWILVTIGSRSCGPAICSRLMCL